MNLPRLAAGRNPGFAVLTRPDRFYKLCLHMTTTQESRSGSRLTRSGVPLLMTLLATAACTTPPETRPEPPVAAVAPTPAPPPVREDERDRLLAQMQLKLLARDAANLRLQAELDEVRQRLDDAVLELLPILKPG